MFFRWADPSDLHRGFAVLPYIKGLTEPLSILLRNNGIQTTSRPLKKLQQEFVSPKSRPTAELPQHENGDLRKIKGGLNLLKAGHPTLRHQLKVLKGG